MADRTAAGGESGHPLQRDYCDRHLMVDYIDEDMMADGAKIVDELQAAVRMLNK